MAHSGNMRRVSRCVDTNNNTRSWKRNEAEETKYDQTQQSDEWNWPKQHRHKQRGNKGARARPYETKSKQKRYAMPFGWPNQKSQIGINHTTAAHTDYGHSNKLVHNTTNNTAKNTNRNGVHKDVLSLARSDNPRQTNMMLQRNRALPHYGVARQSSVDARRQQQQQLNINEKQPQPTVRQRSLRAGRPEKKSDLGKLAKDRLTQTNDKHRTQSFTK